MPIPQNEKLSSSCQIGQFLTARVCKALILADADLLPVCTYIFNILNYFFFFPGSFSGTPGSVKSSSGSSVQSPQDFLSFSESEMRTDTYHHPQQVLPTKDTLKGEAALQEGTVNAFSSLMGLSTNPVMSFQTKNFDGVSGDFTNTGLSVSGYKRVQSSMMEEDTVKEKKRRGNKQSKQGPGRPKGSKNQDTASQLSVSSASPTSSVASAAGSTASSGLQRSPTMLRNGSLQSLSVGSSPVGSGT